MEQQPIPLSEFNKDPITEFKKWYALATASEKEDREVNAMTLATASKSGMPSARTVLYKGISDEDGILFYTNYESAKAQELEQNPQAALVFYWPEIYRQVRVEGKVEKISRKDSESYFKSRPRDSQLGAWASHQSQSIESFEAVENHFAKLKKDFDGKEIPCPTYWGGFAVLPRKIEFWVGGTRRLHQRICYEKNGGLWKITLLSP